MFQQLHKPLLNGLGGISRGGQDLADRPLTRRGIYEDEVRERPADVDAHAMSSVRAQVPSFFLPLRCYTRAQETPPSPCGSLCSCSIPSGRTWTRSSIMMAPASVV